MWHVVFLRILNQGWVST